MIRRERERCEAPKVGASIEVEAAAESGTSAVASRDRRSAVFFGFWALVAALCGARWLV